MNTTNNITPPSTQAVRALLRHLTGGDFDLAPDALQACLQPLVKRLVSTGHGPRGLARWVSDQQKRSDRSSDTQSTAVELTNRLVQQLLPSSNPYKKTVIDRGL